jgi:arginine deiminase
VSCRYEASEELKKDNNPTVTEDYKRGVLVDLDAESLVSLVYTRPVIHLVKEDLNTFIAISKIEINPMSNLIFIEDQQILTSKGIILCNSTMAARKF